LAKVFDIFRKAVDQQIKKIKSELEESEKESTRLEKKISDIQNVLIPKTLQHHNELTHFDETYLMVRNSTQATPLTTNQNNSVPFNALDFSQNYS